MSGEVPVFVALGEKNLLAARMYSHRHRGVESASFVYDDRFLASADPAHRAGPVQDGANGPALAACSFPSIADLRP